MKYLFTAAIVAAALIACNSNDDKTTETKEAGHDAHASTATAVEMPPMPEVPANARVYFANLKDGQTVTSPLKVEMAVKARKVIKPKGY